ncbi:hypothetical protein [Anaerorhabdus sp.]|uniref:hypothetical protein n=1 Tax=Anaerorhabdus sp. TaxID=1872524 RepID=UPI002FC6C6DA
MDIFSLDIFKYLWWGIGVLVMFAGIGVLSKSAKASLEKTKSGSMGSKIFSILDEVLIGLLMVGGLYFIFFTTGLGDIVQFAGKIVVWIWTLFIVPLLQLFGVPV